MKIKTFSNRTLSIIHLVVILLLSYNTINAGIRKTYVHPYSPFYAPYNGPGGNAYPSHVKSDIVSRYYNVRVENIEIKAIEYNSTGFGNQGHNMDVARFASDSRTPEIKINLKGNNSINNITIHPVEFYPQEKLSISNDRKTLTFRMAKELPYAIVIINGSDPQDASDSNPQLTLINDPLENKNIKSSLEGENVLNFKTFAEDYLKNNPITDTEGEICRQAGSVTDASLNDDRMFTWNYGKGVFTHYESKYVAFPNKRARNRNDVSDALQAALDIIKNTPELNTLYIPEGTYLWSGLRITDWNGDRKKGGKPLFVYTDENAMMINRLKECRESNEPAIYIANSSFVTISGRGIHDGQGCYTLFMDRKDARNTPHQGGAVIKKSNNITFNDTYIRNSQQWNWEIHDATDISFNNIKGLSPYNHGWIDGLNMSSGKNITVNGSITLGNDDLFASGHYNPSDEFPRRTYTEYPSVNLYDTDNNPKELKNTFAAAGIYNKDRMEWSRNGASENINIKNAIGWTRTAHCIRIGSDALAETDSISPKKNIKGYYFDNFHAVAGRNAGGEIRIQNNSNKELHCYGEIVIKNSSFWTPSKKWALIPVTTHKPIFIRRVVLENLRFVKPVAEPYASLRDIGKLKVKNITIGDEKL